MNELSLSSVQVPVISIALATFNGERYLRRQLDSIYAQTYENIEVVAADDNSTDNTVSILREYEKKCGLRLILGKENVGYIKNFERALIECSGSYIALSDQDDIWEPEKLEVLFDILTNTESTLVYSNATLIDETGKRLCGTFKEVEGIEYVRGHKYEPFYFFNCVAGCTSLVHKNVIDMATPFPDGIIVHDWWIAYVAARTGNVDYTDQCLIRYRLHESNEIGITENTNKSLILRFPRVMFNAFRRVVWNSSTRGLDERYRAYFLCCKELEESLSLNSATTSTLIHYIDDYRHKLSLLKYWGFFKRHPDLLSIAPHESRLFRRLERIVPLKLLAVLFMFLVAALLLLLIAASL